MNSDAAKDDTHKSSVLTKMMAEKTLLRVLIFVFLSILIMQPIKTFNKFLVNIGLFNELRDCIKLNITVVFIERK